jgi:hypothetical protein
MTSNTIVTDIGLAKIAAAAAAGTTVRLKYFAIGDASYIPSGRETQLMSEQFRKEIDSSSVDNEYKDTMLLNVVLPANVGGWYIREYGILDEDDSLIAIGSCDEIYKPSGDNKSKAVTIAFTIAAKFSNIDSVEFNIKLDGYADVKYVNQQDKLVKDWVNDRFKNNIANHVTAKLTPTFMAGEKFILSPVNFEGAVQQTIVFNRRYIDVTSTGYGTDSVTVVITHNASQAASSAVFEVISHTLPIDYFGFKTFVLDSPRTINGVTIPAWQVVYLMYLKKSLPASINTQNSVSGDYLSASQDFINNINQYPILFEPVADGVFTGSTAIIPYETKSNLRSPAFTDEPTAPTAPKGTNTDQLATMAAIIEALADYTATTSLTELLALKANLRSPAFTDKPTAPTAAKGTNTDQLATMAALIEALADYTATTSLTELLALKANLRSPAFTDEPTAPTAAKGTNTDQLATMTAIIEALADYTTTTKLVELLALKANLKSPAFTDKPTAPTAPKGTRTDQLATMTAILNALADYTTTTNLQNNSLNLLVKNIGANNAFTATGQGDQNGYGFVAITPKGVHAPNGNSDFGNISMRKSTATQGIVYPNTPGAAGPYSMEFGWNGSRVVGRVDNNNTALFALANYSDIETLQNAGGNNFLWLTSGTFSGSVNIGGTLYAPTGNYVLILSQVFLVSGDADSRASFSFNGFGSTTASFGARLNTGSATLQFLCLWGKRGSILGI